MKDRTIWDDENGSGGISCPNCGAEIFIYADSDGAVGFACQGCDSKIQTHELKILDVDGEHVSVHETDLQIGWRIVE